MHLIVAEAPLVCSAFAKHNSPTLFVEIRPLVHSGIIARTHANMPFHNAIQTTAWFVWHVAPPKRLGVPAVCRHWSSMAHHVLPHLLWWIQPPGLTPMMALEQALSTHCLCCVCYRKRWHNPAGSWPVCSRRSGSSQSHQHGYRVARHRGRLYLPLSSALSSFGTRVTADTVIQDLTITEYLFI